MRQVGRRVLRWALYVQQGKQLVLVHQFLLLKDAKESGEGILAERAITPAF